MKRHVTEVVLMPRPRKYTSDAEKARAYRLRKKLKENEEPPELAHVARLLHRQMKKNAHISDEGYMRRLGKTPMETLLRVVVYDLLFERYLPSGSSYDLPPMETLIKPAHGCAPDLPSWMISPDNIPEEARPFVLGISEEEDEEDDEDGSA
jgi:hypothetical protein